VDCSLADAALDYLNILIRGTHKYLATQPLRSHLG